MTMHPELVELDPEQKLILAGELWKGATTPGADSPELSPEAVRMLEERLEHFEKIGKELTQFGVPFQFREHRKT